LDQRTQNPKTRRLVTIPEGVDMEELSYVAPDAHVRSQLGIPEDHAIVASIARIQPGKGQRELIEAAALVLRERPRTVFLIVGHDDRADGSFVRELQQRAAVLGIEKNVMFTGWWLHVWEILAIVDVFVHCPTTWIEGLGISNLEAMAMGKATIVSNNGGLPDAVVDGVTGFVVPPGDVASTADRILRLLRDPSLAARMGQNAHARAEREFNARDSAQRFEALLREYAPGPH
jgi:phosphatidylinositol alpha-1,6-mannosyltransferase